MTRKKSYFSSHLSVKVFLTHDYNSIFIMHLHLARAFVLPQTARCIMYIDDSKWVIYHKCYKISHTYHDQPQKENIPLRKRSIFVAWKIIQQK